MDNIVISTIPEPSALELLVLGGLAGTGVFALRKKR
ncbi:MAG: PEP-CTERM sorting domain-containing protein [Nanoarchaeota archaeon]|nr:PEP-CTERM sorting domain-containing protein [Nanoarchaeota archaeon]